MRAPWQCAPFTSEGGRAFTVGRGERRERYEGDPLWCERYPLFYGEDEAGYLFCSETYGTTASGLPRWHATIRQLYWARARDAPDGPGRGIGYDVAAFDTAEQALAAWARSADQILDYERSKKGGA